MPDSSNYSSRQLTIAKCIVLLVLAVPFGLSIAEKRSGQVVSVVVVAAMLMAAALIYELLARGVARILGRFYSPAASSTSPANAAGAMEMPSRTQPELGDIAIACAWYLGANFLVWTVATFVAMGRAGMHTEEAVIMKALVELAPVALPASVAAGGLALVLTLRKWRRRFGWTATNALIGGAMGRWPQLLLGAMTGAALAGGYFALTTVVEYQPDQSQGLLTQIADSSAAGRWSWALTALILAPPIEEGFFRGALLGTLMTRWGASAAILLSGGAFWVLHAPEWVHYWPAALGVAGLTLAASILRLRWRALGPAVAAHFAYNATLVIAVLL